MHEPFVAFCNGSQDQPLRLMPTRRAWSRTELLAAGWLYCRLPFGRFHHRNPEVIRLAEAIGRTPSAVAMKLCNLASLDPAITSAGRSGLQGASAADRAIWQEMHSDWPAFALAAKEAAQALSYEAENDEQEPEAASDYTGHERSVTRAQRVGQSLFRDAVLTAYNARCCITGLAIPKLLVASHIVPWREAPGQRLNPANGLCLSSLHDRAFDIGLITIRADWTIAVSPTVEHAAGDFWYQAVAAYEGREISRPERFSPSLDFLARHRAEVFLQ
ncbi:HNH endonuclease [Salinisphaera sp. LB1]|uniref:HNH endonuclease n=1 Tax=Salinisphaera sp. LB1 TaxID=2183911 RepID=UPI000D7D7B1B|nr:HNH endonuclease [Salinisphaera sp. LB1]AWN16181.1 putative restriction endonuclease [Salinisphaera sp. LB1]